MAKFKVGDIIVGTTEATRRYRITEEGVKCMVLRTIEEIEKKYKTLYDTMVFLGIKKIICRSGPNIQLDNGYFYAPEILRLVKKGNDVHKNVSKCE